MKAHRVGSILGVIVIVAAVWTPAFAQAPAGAVQIKRPNLVVSNLDRSLGVYRDILGFKVFAISESGPDSYSYPVFQFPKTAKLRMATLNTETGVRILALTEMTGAPLPPKPVPHRDAIVIEVKGLDEIIAKVKAAGLPVVPSKPSKTPEGLTFLEQAFEDYDGHLIVLYEIRGGQD